MVSRKFHYERSGLACECFEFLEDDTGKDYRTYADADIQRLTFIRHARDVGFSLAQIGELLAFRDAPSHNCEEILHFTNKHIAELSEKIDALQTMKDKLLELQKTSCLSDGKSGCAIMSFEVG